MRLGRIALVLLSVILLTTLLRDEETPIRQVEGMLKIYRDEMGVPHILADSKENLFYGLGFAEAQDRMWGLHLKKMICLGRASEMFGSEVLPLDRYTRNLNMAQIGQRNAKLLDDPTRKLLQHYVDGINDYVKSIKVYPLEFYLFWTNWDGWTIEDCHSLLGFFSFNLEFDWMFELARQRLKETVGWRLAMKLIPSSTADLFIQTTIVKDDQLKQMGRYKKYDVKEYLKVVEKHWRNLTVEMTEPHIPDLKHTNIGSNAWVISGNHTKNGRPLLSNDPHLGNVIPPLFAPAELILVDKKGNVLKQAFGAKNDGMPGLSLGVNKHFAWGATALYADGKDIFIQTVRNTSDNLRKEYLIDGEWRPLLSRVQTFNVKGTGEVKQTYYDTHRGPLMTTLLLELHLKYGFPFPEQYENMISLSAVSLHPDGDTLKGMMNLAFSETHEEFITYGSLLKSVNIDSAFITANGSIGYGAIGRICKKNIPEMGSFIKNGSTSIYDFLDYYTVKELPFMMDPERGYIAMTNNKFASDNFDLRGSLHQPSNARALRIENLIKEQIKEGKKFTFQDMMDFHDDSVDAFVELVKGKWVSILKKHRLEWKDKEFSEKIVNLVEKWNCSFNRDLIEPGVYSIWEHEFQSLLLQNSGLTESERISITNHAYFSSYFFKMIDRLGDNQETTDDDRLVCENNLTKAMNPSLNPCVANMIIALNKLEKSLYQWFGTLKQDQWRWGTIHKTHFTMLPWSQIPVIGRIWNRRVPASGNSQTLNVGVHSFQSGSFSSYGSAIFRFITDINTTYYSVNAGLSDRVRSPFYDNFLEDFYAGKYEEYRRINPLRDPHNWKELSLGTKHLT